MKKVLGIVKKLGLPLRQSYTFVLKKIYRDQRLKALLEMLKDLSEEEKMELIVDLSN